MAFDLESIISGGGSGFVTGILAFLGFNKRLTKLEDEKLDKKSFSDFKEDIDKKLDRIEGRVEKLFDKIINGKG